MIGVAMDVQGVAAARPWYEKHKLTYPMLVDATNALGRAIGFTIIPNEFFVDEVGVFHDQLRPGELAKRLSAPLRAVPPDLRRRLRDAVPQADLAILKTKAQRADDFDAQLAAGKRLLADGDAAAAVRYLRRAVDLRADSAETLTTLATAQVAVGDKVAAAQSLRKARAVDPGNWLIRKQIWALEHPEHFYEGAVDFQWQRAQMRREAKGND